MMRARTIGILTIFLTFTMLVVGVAVHNYGDPLICKSWPLCYGANDPTTTLGISAAHRFLGLVVGIFTFILSFSIVRNRDLKEGTVQVGFLALFLVGLQGLMGGLSSQYQLPKIVNTSHFVLSLSFLSTLIFLDYKMAKKRDNNHLDNRAYQNKWYLYLSDGLGLLIFLLFATLTLGSLLRHSAAIDSCSWGRNNAADF